MKRYAAIVIGSGSAGFAALEGLHAGEIAPLAMVERRKLGGECPNYACVPTKALLRSAEVYHLARHANDYGITVENPGFDWDQVVARMEEITGQTGAATAEQDLKNMKVDLLWGEANFRDPHTLEIAGKRYQADRFIIATGSTPRIPDLPGLEEAGFVTSDQAITLTPFPRRLVILGGGPVGTEMSQIFSRFGAEVTVVQRAERILPREEPEISEFVRQRLTGEGVTFALRAQATRAEQVGGVKRVHIETADGEQVVEGDEILVATGREAAVKKLKPEVAGVKIEEGSVAVNDELRTSVPHVWAGGDVIGGYLYTHAASYQGWVIGQNMTGSHVHADFRVIPRGTFTDPEVASVGVTAAQAEKSGHHVQTALSYYGGGRSLPAGDEPGLVKLVIDPQTRKLLGGSLAGPYAAEIVHELAVVMQADLPVDVIGETVHAFPTYAESLLEAVAQLA